MASFRASAAGAKRSTPRQHPRELHRRRSAMPLLCHFDPGEAPPLILFIT